MYVPEPKCRITDDGHHALVPIIRLRYFFHGEYILVILIELKLPAMA